MVVMVVFLVGVGADAPADGAVHHLVQGVEGHLISFLRSASHLRSASSLWLRPPLREYLSYKSASFVHWSLREVQARALAHVLPHPPSPNFRRLAARR